MSTASPIGRPKAIIVRRALLAVLVFFGVLLIGIVVSFVVGLAFDQQLEAVLPDRTGSGDSRGMVLFLLAAFPMAAFLAGLVGALVVWDPKIAPRTEAIGLILALVVVAATWSTDVILPVADTLYSVRALVVFELIGASLAIGALVLVFRWNVDRPTLIGIKAIVIFLITGFLVLAPLMLATNYFLVKFKVPISLKPDGWAGALGGLLSLAVSLVGLGRKVELGASSAKSS